MGQLGLPRIAKQSPPQRSSRAPLAVPPARAATHYLADILRPECNSFGVLRLVLALAVVISHAVFLHTGSSDAEPLVALTGYSLGQYGVQGFFILSGLLVTQSLAQRGDVVDYLRARVMRIFPALTVCVLLTAFAVGPLFSTLAPADYVRDHGVYAYLARTLTLSTGSAGLPGLFTHTPAPGVVNQSLWTLKYEAACYLLLAALAGLGGVVRNLLPTSLLQGRRLVIPATIVAWAGAMVWLQPNLRHGGGFGDTLAYFVLFFGTGAVAFVLRSRIPLSGWALPVLAALFALGWNTGMAEITSAACIGYALVWLASFRFGPLRALTAANDYSYGTYIYSYPITQMLLDRMPALGLPEVLALALAITLGVASLSWEWVEKPALALVHKWRQQRRPVPLAARVTRLLTRRDQAVKVG